MASLFRQETQILPSDLYNDALAAGGTLESAPVSIEDDFNSLRSQIKRFTGETNWFDTNSGRTIAGLETDLADIEAKRLLFRAQVITDITVTAAQNWEVLVVASSETPSETAALGAVTTLGAVCVAHGGTFGTTHSLAEVAGANTLNPKNLLVIRDATTGDAIQSGGKQIWGLLQTEDGVDGHVFDDATKQVQISFVIENGTGDDLIACPVGDIATKSINYSYVVRTSLDTVPEAAFLHGAFVDLSGGVDVTLDNAIDNQSGPATQVQNIDVRITDTFQWAFSDSAGANIFAVSAAVGADEVEMNVDVLDINNTATADFLNGATFDSGGTAINIGDTAGQIDSAAALTVATAAGGDLTLNAAGEILFVDTNKGGSTFAGALKLGETSAEWSAYETAFGEVSLLNALVQAAASSTTRQEVFATVVNGPHIVGANITGAAAAELDTQLIDYSTMTFASDVVVHHNGQRLISAAGATEDTYPGTTPATGDIKLTRKLKDGDKIIMTTWA